MPPSKQDKQKRQEQKERLVLASQSPRRATILRDAGFLFQTVDPDYDEPSPADWAYSPERFAETVSYYKARSVAADYPGRIILSADTVVAYDGEIFGKPADAQDARRILSILTGSTHQVITGVTILEAGTDRQLLAHAHTRITMRKMTDAELTAYIDSGEWQGKAGAYAIQETADVYVQEVDGSFTNVVGLPIELVTEMLSDFGLEPVNVRDE